jgi:putative hydrolase of the HAD superfamily
MPKAVLFDLDDTLTDRRASLDRYVAQLILDFSDELEPAEVADVVAVINEVDERGYAPRERVFSTLQSRLEWRSVPELSRFAEHWQQWFPRSTILRQGALEVLKWLRGQGITLGVITNGRVDLQQPKIDQVGIAPFLSVIVISEQVGCHKPDARVFQRALDQLACASSDVWFVGDHPRNDVLGAAAVGVKPIWLAGIHPWPDDCELPAHQIETLEGVILAVQAG